MKAFLCRRFAGQFVPGCAVVIAEDVRAARQLLVAELQARKIPQSLVTLEEIDLASAGVLVLRDGTYGDEKQSIADQRRREEEEWARARVVPQARPR